MPVAIIKPGRAMRPTEEWENQRNNRFVGSGGDAGVYGDANADVAHIVKKMCFLKFKSDDGVETDMNAVTKKLREADIKVLSRQEIHCACPEGR